MDKHADSTGLRRGLRNALLIELLAGLLLVTLFYAFIYYVPAALSALTH